MSAAASSRKKKLYLKNRHGIKKLRTKMLSFNAMSARKGEKLFSLSFS